MNFNNYFIEPVRQNLPCGFDENNLSLGREPCQMGWYDFIGKRYLLGLNVTNIIDVGCGMGNGVAAMQKIGCKSVIGQDMDTRLNSINSSFITHDVSLINDDEYDAVTCFDVIEHVIEDKLFFQNLKRIAKKFMFITTPNYSRSHAQNHCHCREYTIPQFANYFQPDELWSGSPDGWTHLLSKTENNGFIDHTRNNKYYEVLPDDLTFTHSTVDGLEWGHILGIFKLKNLTNR